MIRLRAATIALSLMACSGGREGDSPAGPGVSNRTLTIVSGRGVVASPGATAVVAAGTKVPYAFTVSPGFGALRVKLDGADVVGSGTVSMDADHTLAAAADSVVVLSRVDSLAIADARTILGSPDPARVFAAQLQRAWTDQAARGTNAAAQTLANVSALAFDAQRDDLAIAVVNSQLAGQIFDLDIGESLAASASSKMLSTSQGPNTLPFTIVYVNGINTTQPGAVDNVFAIRNLIAQAGLPDYARSNYRVKYVYNATWSERRSEKAFCAIAAVTAAVIVGKGAFGTVDLLEKGCGLLLDLTRSALDVAELLGWSPAVSKEATALAALISAERREGRAVVMFAHSQGTLIAQNAMKLSLGSSTDFNASLQKCVGFVSLAGPAPNGFALSHQKNLYVQGLFRRDIILNLPTTAGSTGIGTMLSAEIDASVAFWKSLFVVDWGALVHAIHLHLINGYLTSPPMRESIQAALRDQARDIRTDCNKPATNLAVLTQPSATGVGLTIDPPPSVQIRDSEGNRVAISTATVTVSISPNATALTGTKTVQAVNGVAAFPDLKVSTAGAYQMTFSSPGLTSVTSPSFVVSPPSCAAGLVAVPFLVAGDLRSTNCQLFGNPASLYDFAIGVQQAVRFQVANNIFAPRITVLTRDRTQSNSITGSLQQGLLRRYLLAPGQYTSALSWAAGALSGFTFQAASVTESTTGCERVMLLRPSVLTTSQSLINTDCNRSGFFADEFVIGGSRGCTVTMRASTFDAYLEVYSNEGVLLAANDDGAGGSDAVVYLGQCYSGNDETFIHDVIVHATSYSQGATGSYSLEFRFESSLGVRGSLGVIDAESEMALKTGGSHETQAIGVKTNIARPPKRE